MSIDNTLTELGTLTLGTKNHPRAKVELLAFYLPKYQLPRSFQIEAQIMNRAYMHTYVHAYILASLTAMAALTANGANAQDNSSANLKPYSVGPAIEFSGGGTSFGIKGRISNPGTPVSVRPIILFGYTPSVSSATFSQAVLNGAANLSGFSA